jgi:hypothetical protein
MSYKTNGSSGQNNGMPRKQKMALSLKSLVNTARQTISGASTPAPEEKTAIYDLFPKVDPKVDGENCDHDCDSCHVNFPRGFKIDEADQLYGFVKGWSTHVLVATGKTDWVRDVADEKGSVMEAIEKKADVKPSNGVRFLSKTNWEYANS